MYLVHPGLDRVGRVGPLCGGIYAVEPVRLRVRLDRAHVRASGGGFDEPSVALRDNDVLRDPKDVLDTPREASIALSDACANGMRLESLVDVTAAGILVLHAVRR